MKKAKAICVLCVDDHPVVRDGLISIIGTQPDMRVIDEASDGREAITKYQQHQPDVVVMDLRMPNLSGVQATREIQVLNHIAKGLRNKEIGAVLNIAEDTVKIHIKNIFGKLNVIDRTAAVVSASQRGIIELDYAH